MRLLRTSALALILAAAMTPGGEAASWMTVTSSSFKDGRIIPPRFAADDPTRTCTPKVTEICPCPGKNVSPDIAWHDAPAGTRSFAILMYDVDGQWGAGVSHFVAYNIAPTRSELKEGEATAGTGFTGGKGTRGNANYIGPCPPRGDGPHHYVITVLATDLAPSLAPGLTRDEFLAKASGHFLASATIGGLFARAYR